MNSKLHFNVKNVKKKKTQIGLEGRKDKDFCERCVFYYYFRHLPSWRTDFMSTLLLNCHCFHQQQILRSRRLKILCCCIRAL